MNTYRRLPILNVDTRWRLEVTSSHNPFTHAKELLVSHEKEAGYALQPVCTFLKRFLSLTGIIPTFLDPSEYRLPITPTYVGR
jgi:hypothetical protein